MRVFKNSNLITDMSSDFKESNKRIQGCSDALKNSLTFPPKIHTAPFLGSRKSPQAWAMAWMAPASPFPSPAPVRELPPPHLMCSQSISNTRTSKSQPKNLFSGSWAWPSSEVLSPWTAENYRLRKNLIYSPNLCSWPDNAQHDSLTKDWYLICQTHRPPARSNRWNFFSISGRFGSGIEVKVR